MEKYYLKLLEEQQKFWKEIVAFRYELEYKKMEQEEIIKRLEEIIKNN